MLSDCFDVSNLEEELKVIIPIKDMKRSAA